MKDVFEQKKNNISDYIDKFNLNEGQNGIVVFINGKVIGFDFVSFSSAYESLRSKLLKSYAMEALLTNKDKEHSVSEKTASEFINRLEESKINIYDSVGYGKDYRFEGRALIGSSLVWQDTVIHMACFKNDGSSQAGAEDTGRMSDYRRRMAHIIID